jgi:hypothetical protein
LVPEEYRGKCRRKKGVAEDRSIGSFVYGAEINGSEGYLLGSRFVFEHAVVRKMK